MKDMGKLIATLEAVRVPKAYDMDIMEMRAIHDASPGGYELMYLCFKYGFLKVQRARAKKAK